MSNRSQWGKGNPGKEPHGNPEPSKSTMKNLQSDVNISEEYIKLKQRGRNIKVLGKHKNKGNP